MGMIRFVHEMMMQGHYGHGSYSSQLWHCLQRISNVMAKLLVVLPGRCKISNKYVTEQITRKGDVNSFIMTSNESNSRW